MSPSIKKQQIKEQHTYKKNLHNIKNQLNQICIDKTLRHNKKKNQTPNHTAATRNGKRGQSIKMMNSTQNKQHAMTTCSNT